MKKEIDTNAIKEDFDNFCKKHEIDSAALIVEFNKTEDKFSLSLNAFSKTAEDEPLILKSLSTIFSHTSLQPASLEIVAKLIEKEKIANRVNISLKDFF